MKQIHQRIQELIDTGKSAAVALIVDSKGSTPRKAGTRMIVYPDARIEGTIGGGILEKRVIEESQQLLQTGGTRLCHFDLTEDAQDSIGAVCGGEVSVFIETIAAKPRLYIFGAGHVSQALARIATELPMDIVVYDNRQELAQASLFPQTVQVICAPFEEAPQILTLREKDYITIMTYDHAYDLDVLYDALQTKVRYIGVVASKRKMNTFEEKLKEKGVDEKEFSRIFAPIGLPIGGNTPVEIAVSIVAEIIQHSHKTS
jgi:xanthine dehydrogenase accessory factor